MADHGYAGEIMKIDLSSGRKTRLATADYAERFLGGRGIGARIFWEMAPPRASAFDPENVLAFVTGPITGFHSLAASRWQVCGKSPSAQPEVFSYANLGERWGSYLKYAGYDGLVVKGKAEKPSYIYVTENTLEIREASQLWSKSSFEAADTLKALLGKGVSVLTIGPAAENGVVFATMSTDDGASGASGLGSVMGSKNIKAVVVAGDRRPGAFDPARLDELAGQIRKMRRGTWKGWLNTIQGVTKNRACWGCGIGCFRKAYKSGGRRYKFFCQSSNIYWFPAQKYGGDWQETALLATRLCDYYGLDTMVIGPIIDWLGRCYREELLTEADTGLPLSKIGSAEFIEKLTGMIGRRQGFGDLLAKGTIAAATEVGKRAQELLSYVILTRGNENKDYDPRLITANALLISTEPRRPVNQIHELTHALWMWLNWHMGREGAFLSRDDFFDVARKFWGGEAAGDFSIYEGKALAAKKIQDRTYAKESLILCDFLWPILWRRYGDDHSGDPAMESRVLAAITGREVDEEELNRIGERIFNLQRAIFLRQGWGGRDGDTLLDYLHNEPLEAVFFDPECIVPTMSGDVASMKGNRIDRRDFENLKSEYYALRNWDDDGRPTERYLSELGLVDVAADLKQRGLLAK